MSKGSRRRPGKGYEDGWDMAFATSEQPKIFSANAEIRCSRRCGDPDYDCLAVNCPKKERKNAASKPGA